MAHSGFYQIAGDPVVGRVAWRGLGPFGYPPADQAHLICEHDKRAWRLGFTITQLSLIDLPIDSGKFGCSQVLILSTYKG